MRITQACCFEENSAYITIYLQSYKQSERDKHKHARHSGKSKDELISDVFLWIPTHVHINVDWLVKTYIHQLLADARCHLEDLPRQMTRYSIRFVPPTNIVTFKLKWKTTIRIKTNNSKTILKTSVLNKKLISYPKQEFTQTAYMQWLKQYIHKTSRNVKKITDEQCKEQKINNTLITFWTTF